MNAPRDPNGPSDYESPNGVTELIPPEKDKAAPPAKLLERLLEVEKSRIESADKRTEILRYAIKAKTHASLRLSATLFRTTQRRPI